jgi:hypothetical protein
VDWLKTPDSCHKKICCSDGSDGISMNRLNFNNDNNNKKINFKYFFRIDDYTSELPEELLPSI